MHTRSSSLERQLNECVVKNKGRQPIPNFSIKWDFIAYFAGSHLPNSRSYGKIPIIDQRKNINGGTSCSFDKTMRWECQPSEK